MALGKYSRVHGRKSSSSYCSTITIVVFVALCLVGVWMMKSSSTVSGQKEDVSHENKNEVKSYVAESNIEINDGKNDEVNKNPIDENGSPNEGQQMQFEDNQGDLTEDATKVGQEEKDEKPVDTPQVNTDDNQEEKSEDDMKESIDTGKENEGGSNDNNVEEKKYDTQVENKDSEDEMKESNDTGKENEDGSSDETKELQDVGKENEVGLSDGNAEEKKYDTQVENKDSEDETKESNDPGNENEDGSSGEMEESNDAGKENEDGSSDDNAEEKKDDTVVENKDSEAGEINENNSDDIGKAPEENVETTEESKNKESTEKQDKSSEVFPSGAQSELLSESATQNGTFTTQATESRNEKEAHKSSTSGNQENYNWKLCKTTSGPDYIPCLDNLHGIKKLRSTKHYEHRERHCPDRPPTCLVPLPEGYHQSLAWPISREKIWYQNVPHTKLAEIKGHQNWVKLSGEYLIFPGGGTQFKHGALRYIDFIQQSIPEIAWGKHSRVVLDIGCGVASFGGFLFDRDVLTMSLAPKDEHEAQVQFALERGIPAISAVMGTRRLPYPGRVFDVVHCARCRVPWHIEGGKLLLELNRLLRPGGLFVWSATPIYQKLHEDIEIWEAMQKLTEAMCWEVVSITRDRVNAVGIAVYRKPTSNECYDQRETTDPPMCLNTDDADAAWNVPLQACLHKVPDAPSERGSEWPEEWPARVAKMPYWLSSSEVGVYGKPAPEDFAADYEHWKRVVDNSYLKGLGINWSTVRNVMDMRAVYGGLAAALKDLNIWVMNIVSIDAPDTLPIIYERGLFGIYHDWCESFSTYPRTYDLLHADHLFSKIKTKCNLMALVSEVDRILRPEGKLIVRDKVDIIGELEDIFKSMQWDVRMTYSRDKEGLLYAQKSMWRPYEEEMIKYAIA